MGNTEKMEEQKQNEIQSLLARIAELEQIEENHKLTAEALKESERRYRELYCMVRLMCDNVPDLIWAKDLDKRFTFVNSSICEKLLNAADTKEPIGKNDMFFAERERFSHIDDPAWHTFGEICRDSDSIVMESKQAERFDEWGNVKGSFLRLDVYKAPFLDENGTMIGTVGCGRDVTREREIEDELRRSEKRYRAIVETQTELICRFLPDGTLTFVNEAYCRYFDKKQQDLIGRSFLNLIPEEDRDYVCEKFNALTPDNPTATYEHRVMTIDGDVRWMRWVDQAIFSNNKQLLEFQSVGWDITERKNIEEELRIAKNHLEEQVKARTAELSLKNEQLLKEVAIRRNAEQELQEAFTSLQKAHEEVKTAQLQIIRAAKMESVGMLAAGVAHEVKNPLATILMGIDYLQTALSSDERTDLILENMEDAVIRADSIIRGLLDYSAVSDILSDECSLDDILSKSINLVKHELDKKNIKLIKELSLDGHLIRLDAEKITQVFVNLMLNAIHATPDGGTIKVTTYDQRITEHDASKSYMVDGIMEVGDRVVIAEIADTGPGIPEDQLVKVFDPFFTTNPLGKGTGLGLTVSKNIIESHGGIIDITNREEGGVSSVVVLKM